MASKARYQFMITLGQREALRRIKAAEGIPEGEQIRRAIDAWLENRGARKADRRRAGTRRRP